MIYKTSIIISVYNRTDFLKLVLDSLKQQTVKDFEIIISEDGESKEMRDFVSNYSFENDYQHLTHEDVGWRKNSALNNAVKKSKSEWLILIDGDCVLHPRFVEMHLRFADDNTILSGRRVKLDEKTTESMLLNPSQKLRKILWLPYKKILLGNPKLEYAEEGLFFSPTGLLFFVPRFRRFNYLLGCNMSFSKKAIYAINGFDETYTNPSVGEDTDIAWRFKALGFKMKSLRNLAVQYHLNHPKNWTTNKENKEKMLNNKKLNKYFCEHGLSKSV
ncbi:glycosyltransferase family 2 protein [Paludibacter sp.]